MNTVTIIFLTSLVTLLQIAVALPMFEVPAHREAIKDNTPDSVDDKPSVVTSESEFLPEVPAGKSDGEIDKETQKETAKETEDNKKQDTEQHEVNDKGNDCVGQEKKEGDSKYKKMNNFVRYAIEEYLGHDYDDLSLTTTEQEQLFDMFLDMEIIQTN